MLYNILLSTLILFSVSYGNSKHHHKAKHLKNHVNKQVKAKNHMVHHGKDLTPHFKHEAGMCTSHFCFDIKTDDTCDATTASCSAPDVKIFGEFLKSEGKMHKETVACEDYTDCGCLEDVDGITSHCVAEVDCSTNFFADSTCAADTDCEDGYVCVENCCGSYQCLELCCNGDTATSTEMPEDTTSEEPTTEEPTTEEPTTEEPTTEEPTTEEPTTEEPEESTTEEPTTEEPTTEEPTTEEPTTEEPTTEEPTTTDCDPLQCAETGEKCCPNTETPTTEEPTTEEPTTEEPTTTSGCDPLQCAETGENCCPDTSTSNPETTGSVETTTGCIESLCSIMYYDECCDMYETTATPEKKSKISANPVKSSKKKAHQAGTNDSPNDNLGGDDDKPDAPPQPVADSPPEVFKMSKKSGQPEKITSVSGSPPAADQDGEEPPPAVEEEPNDDDNKKKKSKVLPLVYFAPFLLVAAIIAIAFLVKYYFDRNTYKNKFLSVEEKNENVPLITHVVSYNATN